jgi:hypothetical protein
MGNVTMRVFGMLIAIRSNPTFSYIGELKVWNDKVECKPNAKIIFDPP